MDREDVQRWLDRYIDAWRSYDRGAIESLFTDDAEYSYHPWDDPIRGAPAIADDWLESPDAPGSWRAEYHPWVVDGDRAVATGTSSYLDDAGAVDRVFHNVYLIDFAADGRARGFKEWFMEQPKA